VPVEISLRQCSELFTERQRDTDISIVIAKHSLMQWGLCDVIGFQTYLLLTAF